MKSLYWVTLGVFIGSAIVGALYRPESLIATLAVAVGLGMGFAMGRNW